MTVIGQIIVGIISSLALIIAAWPAIKKARQENESTLVNSAGVVQDSALELMVTYKTEASELRADYKKLEAIVFGMKTEMAQLKLDLECVRKERNEVISGAYVLLHQVQSAGIPPAYMPPEYRRSE